MAEKKEIRYVSDNAQLMTEWDWEKNTELELDPHKLTCGSGIKAWWKCHKGHEWQANIYDRHNGRGCPVCSGKKVLMGFNDLQTINPFLSSEWNVEKNGTLKPNNFTVNSSKFVWWRCKEGHEWQATIANRNSGTGCPYCSGNKVLTGYNDLQTVNPVLANEWNFDKNAELVPTQILQNSGKKVWWKCTKGHEWQATVESRNKGAKCPYCFGLRAIKGETDLQTVNPVLAKEWNYNKNGELLPVDITAGSSKKVWWICSKGHEWQATIYNRHKGNGCPTCNSEQKTSFPEYALIYYLERNGFEVIHSYKGNGYELDVYIPSVKVAIEYDGYFWHKNKTRSDLIKNKKCEKDGIKLYRIREDLLSLNDTSIDYFVRRDQKDLPTTLWAVIKDITGTSVDVDLERDLIAIENLREHTEKELSLCFSNSTLATEWNYEKNEKLRPEHVTANSSKKVWWICNEGHKWQATIASRNRGNGCPYCGGKKTLTGYNDLQTVNSILAKEWNYEKNANIGPDNFTVGSHKKVWWKCNQGHEWQATISSRNKGNGCPYCSGRYAVIGKNDLQTSNPVLAKEWDYEKNGQLTPRDVMSNSSRTVWWKCSECGHCYSTSIYNRTRGFRCPICKINTAKSNLR